MDIAANNWNETDGSNTGAAPDGAAEGMAPSGLNDVLRAHQGAVKRWYNWTIPKVTGGTGTAYTLSYSVPPGALVDGMTHLVQFHAANGNAPTLNVNSLGAIPLQYYSAGAWRAVPASLFDVDTISRATYNLAAGAYRLLDIRGTTGEVKPFAGATAPAGYLLCAGQTVSRTAYAGLFAVLGTTYGAGDGSTTFSLPDLRDRVVAGHDSMGGSSAGRLDGTVPRGTLGGSFGGQYNTATASVSGTAAGGITVTSISMDGPSSTFGTAGNTDVCASGTHTHANVVSTGNATLAVSASGTSGAFSIVQPTYILNQIIRI